MATKKKSSKKKVGKKKVAKNSVDAHNARYIELVGQLNQGGNKVIARACDVPNTYSVRRPSGVTNIDLVTAGGLPAGGLSCLTGPEGSGKSEMMINYMSMHQKIYGEHSYIAIAALEGQFDFRLTRRRGLKVNVPPRMIEQFREQRFDCGEADYTPEQLAEFSNQIGVVDLIGGDTGEDVLNTILDCYSSRIFGIIGLDSINGLLPASNADKDLSENDKMAARALLVTRFLDRFLPATAGVSNESNESTLIFIQQVRANKDKSAAPSYMQKYLKNWAGSSAWATKHTKLMDIEFESGGKITAQRKGVKTTIGKEVRWRVTKSKAGCPEGGNGVNKFTFDDGLDTYGTLVDAGLACGVVKENSRTLCTINVDGEILMSGDSRTEFIDNLRADSDLELAVRKNVMVANGVRGLYR